MWAHTDRMISHMNSRTTLILPDELMRELKRRAAERGETLSAVVEEALRRGLEAQRTPAVVEPLPTYGMGAPRADLADRDDLYRVMEEEV